jgi:hypothetical protein
VTAERLRELYDYDAKTGHFLWKGTERIAGSISASGRRRIKADGRTYPAHRLAFLWMTGEWPKSVVDHKDGDPANNAWNNLRDVTYAQNNVNRRVNRLSASGYKGVVAVNGRWLARIRKDGVQRRLGLFDTPEEAYAAYCEAAKELHGEFARLH